MAVCGYPRVDYAGDLILRTTEVGIRGIAKVGPSRGYDIEQKINELLRGAGINAEVRQISGTERDRIFRLMKAAPDLTDW